MTCKICQLKRALNRTYCQARRAPVKCGLDVP